MTEKDIKELIEELCVLVFTETERGRIEMRVDGGHAAKRILEGLKQKAETEGLE